MPFNLPFFSQKPQTQSNSKPTPFPYTPEPQIAPISGGVSRLFDDANEDKSKPLLAVIVTINNGGSYDALFSSQKQEPPEGGRVAVWSMTLTGSNMDRLQRSLDNRQEVPEEFKELFEDLSKVEPGEAVFNFECCGGCSKSGFHGIDRETISAIASLLHHGFFVMCSDFSLMALLAKWDTKLLGSCPFGMVGSYSSNCELRFVPGVLKECASAQLVTVGNLCENGEAHVHAMSGTIAYAPKTGFSDKDEPYTLEILTVITKADGKAVNERISGEHEPASIKEYSGYAGHSMLTYKTGGNLLLSSCHWMELSRLSTNEENVFKTFEQNYGTEFAQNKRMEFESMPMEQRSSQLQCYATEMVQKSAPCRYKKM